MKQSKSFIKKRKISLDGEKKSIVKKRREILLNWWDYKIQGYKLLSAVIV